MTDLSATDICFLEATELNKLYSQRKLSPVEVSKAVLARIAKLDRHVNSYVNVDEEAATAAAIRSEARWLKSEPLGDADGIPTGIKDLVLAKGWPTLRGSKATVVDQPWDQDGPATARLREQGAVLLGKTTTAEFGSSALTDNLVTGVTRNPWNFGVTPGGSSGGSGAAAAFGFGQFHVATDGGGSGRLPASHCGVVGFKATHGRVSAFPYAPTMNLHNVTPRARTVRDVAALLDVIGKPDASDWYALPAPAQRWADGLTGDVKGLRVAFSPDLGYANVDPEVAAIVARAVNVFSDLGCVVDQAGPVVDDPLPIFNAIWAFGAAKSLKALGERGQLTQPTFQKFGKLGEGMDAVAVLDAIEKREQLGRQFASFYQNWDVLVTPMAAEAPASFADIDTERSDGRPLTGLEHITPFGYPFNLTFQPALSIPCGRTSTGLPVGLQIVGPKFADHIVLKLAHAFEATGQFSGRPIEP